VICSSATRAQNLFKKPDPMPASSPAPAPGPEPELRIAWGAKVSGEFKDKVIAISGRLRMEPDHLMAIMAFETGRSFDPAVTNHAGSGATGLIQFMPAPPRGWAPRRPRSSG
jgi:soluble lytic murein transglycosylase-like protein